MTAEWGGGSTLTKDQVFRRFCLAKNQQKVVLGKLDLKDRMKSYQILQLVPPVGTKLDTRLSSGEHTESVYTFN